MSELLTTKTPGDLEALGYLPPAKETLEDSGGYQRNRQTLEIWTQRLPGLRTPRNPDGSGGTPPKPHQLRHVSVAGCRRHNFLSWSMGVGKTPSTILVALLHYGHQLFAGVNNWTAWSSLPLEAFNEKAEAELKETVRLTPGTIHVVGPRNTLSKVWLKELTRMNLGWAAEVIRSEDQMYESKAPIWIYHFDLMKEQSKRGKACKRQGGGLRLKPGGGTYFRGHPLAKVVAKRFAPSLLVIDECHRLRGDSQRTQDLRIIRRKAQRVLGLTGTPMDGWVHHAATIFGFIYGLGTPAYPFTDEEFARQFTRRKAVAIDYATGKEAVAKERPVPGIAHNQIPAFIRATRHLMHRLSLSDPEVRSNVVFPRVERHLVRVPMDPAHEAFYTGLHRQGLANIQAAFDDPSAFRRRTTIVSLMTMLRQAASAPWSVGYRGPGTALVEQVITLVRQEAGAGRKILIGTQFIDESRHIHTALAKAGFKGVRLYAEDPTMRPRTLSQKKREDLIEQFQDEPDCVYMLSNKELIAEGLNLAEYASVLISCSNGYRSNIEDQWEGRVIRPGQSWSHVTSYTLLVDNSICIFIYLMLQAKLKASSSLLDLDFSGEAEGLMEAVDPVELAKRMVCGSAQAVDLEVA